MYDNEGQKKEKSMLTAATRGDSELDREYHEWLTNGSPFSGWRIGHSSGPTQGIQGKSGSSGEFTSCNLRATRDLTSSRVRRVC